jgi:rubredoxin-NAD+ reductase
MKDSNSIVIVGTGLAGYGLAKELRKRDPRIPITLLTADGGEVYTKPMLSNALARHHRPDDLVQKEAATLAHELRLEIRTRTRVGAIDRGAQTLAIEDAGGSSTLPYGRLVLALGANARIFPAAGSDAVPIARVNDLDDYRQWRERIDQGGRILLIGAGLIGCEFANDLAGAGLGVTLVDPAPWPLARLLPQPIGERLMTALQGIGCTLHLGRKVVRYAPAAQGFLAELDDGTQVSFEHALSAVGLAPRTALAAAAGLEVGTGILVDRLLRTTDPAIHALGDCAETPAGLQPFIAPLLAQTRTLAATLSGAVTPLHLPALPVVVKTPALPLVICPPPPGASGTWELDLDGAAATALFRAEDGTEIGFALAGARTRLQHTLARRMPDLLP